MKPQPLRRRTLRVLAAMTLTLAATAPALVATTATTAQACDLCAIYTGSLMRQDNTGVFLGVSEQYTDFGNIQVDGTDVANPDNEWMRSSITQIVAGYQLTPRIAVQANLPLISREYRRLEDGMIRRGDAGGAGDLSLIGRYTPVSRAMGSMLVHVEVFAGLKLPTGDSDRLAEERAHQDDDGDDGHGDHGEAFSAVLPPGRSARNEEHGHASAIHGHDLALGSGSVDGVFGATFYADWKRLFGEASMQYLARGNGDSGYEYADDFTWEVGPGFYVVTENTWTGAVRLVVSGEVKGRDHQDGALLDDTKLTAVYAGPGLAVTWSNALAADFACDLPVDQDASGRQIVADYRLRAGMSWRF